MIDLNIPPHKDKFRRRCCYNCKHHRDFQFNGETETLVCSLKARVDMGNYIGVDYSKRMEAWHEPCEDWEVETNVPKGFKWPFLDEQPKQLTIQFD